MCFVPATLIACENITFTNGRGTDGRLAPNTFRLASSMLARRLLAHFWPKQAKLRQANQRRCFLLGLTPKKGHDLLRSCLRKCFFNLAHLSTLYLLRIFAHFCSLVMRLRLGLGSSRISTAVRREDKFVSSIQGGSDRLLQTKPNPSREKNI